MPIIKKGVTLKQVQQSKSDTIYYSSKTIWWTDDPNDLQTHESTLIPLYIFGALLYEAPKDEFLKQALSNAAHYGSGGFDTFMATHHKNFKPSEGDKLAIFTNFEAINKCIEELKAKDQLYTLLK